MFRCHWTNICEHFSLSHWVNELAISVSSLYISYTIKFILVTVCAFGLHIRRVLKNIWRHINFDENYIISALPFFVVITRWHLQQLMLYVTWQPQNFLPYFKFNTEKDLMQINFYIYALVTNSLLLLKESQLHISHGQHFLLHFTKEAQEQSFRILLTRCISQTSLSLSRHDKQLRTS
jgi:hypothetical protein